MTVQFIGKRVWKDAEAIGSSDWQSKANIGSSLNRTLAGAPVVHANRAF
jgi:hypothetical protein